MTRTGMVHGSLSGDRAASIVLAGGASRRMGTDKASADAGGVSFLGRVVAAVARVTPRIVVVAGVDQALPHLGADCSVVRDERPFEGPLAGFVRGLAALPPSVEHVFLTGTDHLLL